MDDQLVDDHTVNDQPEGDTPALEEKPAYDQLALGESVPDERPPIKEQADDDLLAQNNRSDEAENVVRGASPGDSEEDLNDATTVCHAIDRLLDEIDSRSDEVKTENGKSAKEECNEEAPPISPDEEKAPYQDEVYYILILVFTLLCSTLPIYALPHITPP